MVISRELRTDPLVALARIQNEWLRKWCGVYLRELGRDPSVVAARLRELAEDPEALAGLAKMAGQQTDRSVCS